MMGQTNDFPVRDKRKAGDEDKGVLMDEKVMLGHGSGGSMMKRIIDDVFFAAYAGEELLRGDDAAVLPAPATRARISILVSLS